MVNIGDNANFFLSSWKLCLHSFIHLNRTFSWVNFIISIVIFKSPFQIYDNIQWVLEISHFVGIIRHHHSNITSILWGSTKIPFSLLYAQKSQFLLPNFIYILNLAHNQFSFKIFNIVPKCFIYIHTHTHITYTGEKGSWTATFNVRAANWWKEDTHHTSTMGEKKAESSLEKK